MGTRFGLGPVFACEWQIASRKWRGYAGRSAFVACLLLGMTAVFFQDEGRAAGGSLRSQAEFGVSFFYAVVGVQLALVMLAAPAATAGAVCLDKARGTLLHVLVTDLTDAEVVLGKLASRLLPTLLLVGCTLPVLALGTLLGGIDPAALTGAFLVTLGVAVFGCSLAFALSVWGTKTQEVLMGTYAFWILWLIAGPLDGEVRRWFAPGIAPLRWLGDVEPFRLAFAPYLRPESAPIADGLLFLAGMLAASALLAGLCIRRLRPVAIRQAHAALKTSRGRSRWFRLPGPDLDFNPVLWREWHRERPSRGARILWNLYFGGSLVFAVVAATAGPTSAIFINAFQVPIGLLMLAVASAASLTEERVRGSLDVLMATPLPTAQIVLGKWWGSVRRVPLLALVALLPALGGLAGVVAGSGRVFESMVSGAVLTVYVLAAGAAVGTLGLALATWIERPGRAVALNVGAVILISAGWFFVIVLVTFKNANQGEGPAMASPFVGSAILTAMTTDLGLRDASFWSYQGWGVFWAFAYGVAALALLGATFATFDRCLGRAAFLLPHHPPRPRPVYVPPTLAFVEQSEPRAEPAGVPG